MNYLRTTNVRVVTPNKAYGMGYRTLSPRNKSKWDALPQFSRWLQHKGFSARVGTSDNKIGTKPLCGRGFDQNMVGSCTAESVCKASRVTLGGKNAMPPGVEDFSQRIFYGQTRQIELAASTPIGFPLPVPTDSGCEPLDCVTSARELGLAPMEDPVGGYYNDVWIGNVNREINLADEEMTLLESGAHVINLASSSRVNEWQGMVDGNVGGTTALFVDTENFMNWDPNAGPITAINLNDPQGGGHQICGPCYWYFVAGKLYWGFLNSWGESWGINGFAEISDDCLMTAIDTDNGAIAYDVDLVQEAA